MAELYIGNMKVDELYAGDQRIYAVDTHSGVIDVEQCYPIVQIGEQYWTSLSSYHIFGDGVILDTNVTCYSNQNIKAYGLLYSYESAMELARHLSKGWRLPSVADVNKLVNFVGGYNLATRDKLCATTKWSGGNGTDNYGLSLVPGGRVDFRTMSYNYIGSNFNAWCSDKIDDENAYSWRCDTKGMGMPTDYNINLGFSLRFVKDA